MKRTLFDVKIACGRCHGTGKGTAKTNSKFLRGPEDRNPQYACPQCAGQCVRWARKYAHELTDDQFDSLSVGEREVATQELLELRMRNSTARILSEQQAAQEAAAKAQGLPMTEDASQNQKCEERPLDEQEWLSRGFVPKGVRMARRVA